MNLIVAVDSNWAIGKENKLLVSIPQDMKFFRETTKGKVVAMGRKTLESFPGGQPLKNRVNVVLTTDKNYKVKDTVIVHTIEEMVDELKKYDSEDIFVIGQFKYSANHFRFVLYNHQFFLIFRIDSIPIRCRATAILTFSSSGTDCRFYLYGLVFHIKICYQSFKLYFNIRTLSLIIFRIISV